MRRKYFGFAIAALATLGPIQAWGGDREIAEQIIQRLNDNRNSGALKDFTLDMKVDQGVVLFRGSVSAQAQHELVLKSAEGIEGIAKVVDEVKVAPSKPQVLKPKAPVAVAKAPTNENESAGVPNETPAQDLAVAKSEVEPATVKAAPKLTMPELEEATKPSFSEALAAHAQTIGVPEIKPVRIPPTIQPIPGEIKRTAAVEPTSDAQVVSRVVTALQQAKRQGQLKGFGVDVKSKNGVLKLTGRAASASQRDTIIRIAENVPGVAGIREAIAVPTQNTPRGPRLPEPPSLQETASTGLAPAPTGRRAPAVRHSSRRTHPNAIPAQQVATRHPAGVQAMPAPYRSQHHAPVQAAPASYGADGAIMGQPVPMAPISAVGAPRYDSPNMPNYAWPGYAAYPNYAALTYPQQYSPTAWPYIGPFYPYPQVPLGWRKVSLEWDDGWWFLDFTDR